MNEDAAIWKKIEKDNLVEIKAIRGFNDILPGEIGKWQFVERDRPGSFRGVWFLGDSNSHPRTDRAFLSGHRRSH